MRKQLTQPSDPTAGAGLPDAPPAAIAGGAGGGPASLALRRLGGLSGRPILWIVLALAAGAALLVGYVQVTQAQEPPMTPIYAPGLALTQGPIVPGDQAGSELSFTLTYTPTTTYPHEVTGMSVIEPGSFTVQLWPVMTVGTSSHTVALGFRSMDTAEHTLEVEREFEITPKDLVCEDLDARPIVCSLGLGSARHETVYAAAGVSGEFNVTATAVGPMQFEITESIGPPGDRRQRQFATFGLVGNEMPRWFVGTMTVALPSPAGPSGELRVSAERGSSEVALRWDNPGDASITGYQYRYKVREGEYGDWTDIADSGADTTEHTVTGLVNGRRHTFQIRALAEQAAGEPSNEVTATPARSRPQLDDFDDPDQPPEPPLPPPPDRTSAFLESGGALRSQPLSPTRPTRATVQSPFGGFIAITIESNEQRIAPPGYTLEGSTVDITAPMASADAPLVLTFEVRTAVAAEELAVLRDGVAVEECAGLTGAADPDPCVSSRTTGNGAVLVTVLTSQASEWQFGVALEPESTPTPTSPPPPTLTPTPTATPTPTPGPTRPTPTPRPTATPTPPPTSTPIPTATPRPTATPTATPTPPAPPPTSTPVPPMDEGGLGAGLIALIVVGGVVIVGVAVFVLRRR